jgi:hypothetical protein
MVPLVANSRHGPKLSPLPGDTVVTLLNLFTLIVATLFAAGMAVALDWLLLRVAFQFMTPAAVRSASPRSELIRGTAELARAFAIRR